MARPKKVQEPITQPIYQFKIRLMNLKPFIDRTIQIAPESTFEELHYAIQCAMGWFNDHLYLFSDEQGDYVVAPDKEMDRDAKLADSTLISDYFKNAKDELLYTYDMGDNWEHSIKLEKIVQASPDTHYPICVSGANACPPEDCGGPWGYAFMLESVNDPESSEYETMREWLGLQEGEQYDPSTFSLEQANAAMMETFTQLRAPKKRKKTSKKAEKEAKQEAKIVKLHQEAKEPHILVNIGTQPSKAWSEEQRQKALADYAGIVDVLVPEIEPEAEVMDIINIMYDLWEEKIAPIAKRQPVVASLSVDLTMGIHLSALLANEGIYSVTPIYKIVQKGGHISAQFVQFRQLFTPEMMQPLNFNELMDNGDLNLGNMMNVLQGQNMEGEGFDLSQLLQMMTDMNEPDEPKPKKKKK